MKLDRTMNRLDLDAVFGLFISQLHMLVLFTGLFREKYFLKNILELLSKLVQSTAHVESCDNATTTVHTSLLHFLGKISMPCCSRRGS